jgi:ribosomal protein S8
MLNSVKNLNLINLAAKNNKINVKIITNKQTLKILNLLTDYNLIEYTLESGYSALVTLKYLNSKPILKSINFMGGRFKNNVKKSYAVSEINNKKAFYIMQTPMGLKTMESAIFAGHGGLILFKVKI